VIATILKKIYHKLPANFRMVILNVFYSVKLNKIYDSPDHFPVNYIENIDLPIFGNSEKEGYFYRYYQEKEVVHNLSPEDLFKYKYEIIYGTYYKNEKIVFQCNEDSVLPISMESHKDTLRMTCDNKLTDEIKNLPPKRYQYFTAEKGIKYSIESDNGVVVGSPIPLKQKIKHKNKLVLCIFLDGLVDSSELEKYEDEQLMPHTSNFFKKGTRFRNHYSNAEWTLPSVPGFFTGTRQQSHGFFAPKDNHVIGKNSKILSELFQEDGYLTYQACGNWRKSPAYGYVKGFDRTVYKKEMNASEIIFSFLEHMRAFKDRDNFIWLTFMEAHHLLKVIPDVSNQIVDSICVTPWYDPDNKKKSVFTSKNDNLIDVYVNEIKRLDYYLKIIFDYLKENFEDDEMLVTVVSDHGQAFVSDDQHPLSLARTKVPWFLFGENVPKQDVYDLTENIDVFETLLKYCNLQTPDKKYDSKMPSALGGNVEREYVFSQSIYPGQTYKAVIRDKNCEYRYESKSVVSINGSILGLIELKDASCINDKNTLKKEYYKKIVIEKINVWNTRNQ
jgi:hypothetical protein